MKRRYAKELILRSQTLRAKGMTYSEIIRKLRLKIPKSTLSGWTHNISLPSEYEERISKLNVTNLNKGRNKALVINKIKRELFLENLKKINQPIAGLIKDKNTAKIALSMLCLGEASKYSSGGGRFCLGSSDHRIIIILLELLRRCFKFDINKIRATVQCRADQDTERLKQYWMKVTGIPEKLFYKPLIDSRTVGKPTKSKAYMGVLRIDYFDTKLQQDLESLADLVYNNLLRNRARSLAG